MTGGLRRGTAPSVERSEQAARAVKAFRAMQPTLTGYARALTGRRDVRVEASRQPGARTDGNTIYIRPPMALGVERSHERARCDRRDENFQLACPACQARESLLITIYHEIAHITFNSFEPVSDTTRTWLLRDALKATHSKYADGIRAKIDALPSSATRTYLGMAGVISPFLPPILNALEDARVNHQMTLARPGTHSMFYAQAWDVFTNGHETDDGTLQVWSDAPLNMQIVIGMFAKASGYDCSNWFSPAVVEDLGDPELSTLIGMVPEAGGASDIYGIAFKALLRLRKLGYCVSDTDPDDEEEEEDVEEEPAEDEGTGDGESPECQDEADADDDGSGGDDDGLTAPGRGDGSTSGTGSGSGDASGDTEESDGESGVDSEEGPSGGPDQERDGEGPDGGDGEASGDSGEVAGVDSDQEADGEASADGAGDRPGGESDNPGGTDAGESPDSLAEQVDDEAEGVGDGQAADEATGDDLPSDDGGAGSGTDGGESDDAGSAPDVEDSPAEGAEREAGSSSDGDSPWDNSGLEPDDIGSSATPGPGESEDSADAAPDATGSESDLDESDAQEPRGGDRIAATGTGAPEPISPAYGDAAGVSAALDEWLGHDDLEPSESKAETGALDRAVEQAEYFDTSSRNVHGVTEIFYDKRSRGAQDPWRYGDREDRSVRAFGVGVNLDVPESIIGPALMRMRVTFSANARGRDLTNLKTGKVNARVLGKRVFGTDERLFKKRVLPGKRDYFVLIGMDVSGSTIGENIRLEKRAVAAQAELLTRMGIKFAIYAHSGDYNALDELRVVMCEIKSPDEHWTKKTKDRLDKIHSFSANLDGHTLEYYRKKLDAVRATDKIIMYYTDGAMPLENFTEELQILKREIETCKKKGYTLLAVGINNNDPVEYGLDTVSVSGDADIVGVVKHLERRLLST